MGNYVVNQYFIERWPSDCIYQSQKAIMKKLILILAPVAFSFALACDNAQDRYLDLQSGEKVAIEKDPETGKMVNVETKKPVYIYVDTKSKDTIYGPTGQVINGHVIKVSDGVYKYDGDGDFKVKDGDYKMKVEKDGDIKIKDGDKKVKVDGETGEKKVKKDN